YHLAALEALERIYADRDMSNELVDVLTRKAKALTEPELIASVKLRTGGLYETALRQIDKAGQVYREVLDLDSSNLLAMRGLERCYRRLRQWLDLINTYDRHINATLDRQKKIELWAHTAKVYADEVQDLDHAIDSYLNIQDLDDANIPALDALAKLYEKQDN